MYNGEEDCILGFRFAVVIKAIAEDEAERVGCLVPSATSFLLIRFLRSGQIKQTRLFVWISKICRGQAVSKEFGKGTTSWSTSRVGEIIMNVRFTIGGEEEEPILFNLRATIGGVAGQLCESWIGL